MVGDLKSPADPAFWFLHLTLRRRDLFVDSHSLVAVVAQALSYLPKGRSTHRRYLVPGLPLKGRHCSFPQLLVGCLRCWRTCLVLVAVARGLLDQGATMEEMVCLSRYNTRGEPSRHGRSQGRRLENRLRRMKRVIGGAAKYSEKS